MNRSPKERRYHVVRIFENGYARMSSHADIYEGACAAVVASRNAISSVVLRDGTTGKRYSIDETIATGFADDALTSSELMLKCVR